MGEVSTAERVRAHLDGLPAGTFVRARDFDGSPKAVDMALSRLARDPSGSTIRVAQGLYWRGVDRRFGPGRPDPLSVALEVAGDGAGPAGWSAARTLGLTTQVPASVEIASLTRSARLDGVEVSHRSNLSRRALKSVEVAVLEVLRTGVERFGVVWSAFVDVVRTLVKSATVRLSALSAAVRDERNTAVHHGFVRLEEALAVA